MAVPVKYADIENRFKGVHPLLLDYLDFLNGSGRKTGTSLIKQINTISGFLEYFANQIDLKNQNQLKLSDFELIEPEIIQDYLFNHLSATSYKTRFIYLNFISAFWTYLTIDSYDFESKKPLFYRNVFNEWRIIYKSEYESLKNSKKENKIKVYSSQELIDLLDYMENLYTLTLDTENKVINWERLKSRNIAMIALICATGLSIESLCDLKLRDINLREKYCIISHNGAQKKVPIIKKFIPYISPYLKERRTKIVVDRSNQYVFLTLKKVKLSSNSFNNILLKLSQATGEKFQALALRLSYASLFLSQGGTFDELVENLDNISLDLVRKYLK